MCVYALVSHRFCQRNRSSKVVGCAHTVLCAGNSIPAHSTTLSLQLLSVVLGARPRCPDLQQHTFVRALDKPSSQVLGTELTVPGKETNRLVLTMPTKPSFSCYKLMPTDLTAAVHHIHMCAGNPWEAISQFLRRKTRFPDHSYAHGGSTTSRHRQKQ